MKSTKKFKIFFKRIDNTSFLILFLTLFLLFSSIVTKAQISGCTDSRANNYNPYATQNDGSCVYDKTNYKAREIISSLPEKLIENSGLILFNGMFWTHNDGGGKAEIYAFDTISGLILKTVKLLNASNIDWEDITQDSNNIFIGDFGNNSGNRDDLIIYKISKSEVNNHDSVFAKSISFSYPDKEGSNTGINNHNFDCEAFFCFNDSLYLFSKNWANNKTKLYTLPTDTGIFEANLIDSFNVDGLITAADIFEDSSQVVLLGYKNYNPFIWLLFDYKKNDFFSGNKRRIDLNGLLGCQAEAVCFTDNKNIIFSSEKSAVIKNKVFGIYFWQWVNDISNSKNSSYYIDDTLIKIYPNPANDNVKIVFDKSINKRVKIKIFDNNLKKISDLKVNLNRLCPKEIFIDLKDVNPGIIYFQIFIGKKKVLKKIIVN